MEQTNIKENIQHALKKFAAGDLNERAKGLLKSLGYDSQMTETLSPTTAKGFLGQFNEEGKLSQERALISDWQYVNLTFQITDDEFQLDNQLTLIKPDGKIEQGNYHSFLFLAIELSGEQYSRSQLAAITREVNKLFQMPVSIVFRHGRFVTIALVTHRLNKQNAEKDVLEKVSLIKDINFAQPHRAHIEILVDLSLDAVLQKYKCQTFDQLQEAWKQTLDITQLNKRFFQEIANWYYWAQKHLDFPADVEQNRDTRNALSAIRLITRLIFVWFIKEKGLVREELFNKPDLEKILKSLDGKESSFYRAILQNLFFATLNREMTNNGNAPNRYFTQEGSFSQNRNEFDVKNLYRYKDYFKEPEQALALFGQTPFLNGGLFECLDSGTQYIDGFSRNSKKQALAPNFLFFGGEKTEDLNEIYGTKGKTYKVRGLIHILERYKFTVTENTPLEEEVALDPELLGKVFENLLAAYNPETKDTARKQTGSFYTPREIVNYMVDEALLGYLSDKLPGRESELRQLFDDSALNNPFNSADTGLLIAAIDSVKILDPACGSGAFPMGILHRMVVLLKKLDPGNQLWKQRQLERAGKIEDNGAKEAARKAIEATFEEGRNEADYGRKLYLIQNCIYGSDIQPIAVQISKLRFFIALVVDQKADTNRPNFGILPLPNLETRFVAANSLLGIERPGLEGSMEAYMVKELEEQLAGVRKDLFNARTYSDKKRLREQDAALRQELLDFLKQHNLAEKVAEKLAAWNPYDQNKHADFFDPEWMFGLTEGFDIVIGNPPYVRQEAIREQKPLLAKALPEVYAGTADLYVYFYGRGFQLLRDGGYLAYISSNKFFRADYGKTLRQFFSNKVKLQTVIDFGDLPIFEATAYPSIIIGSKGTPVANHKLASLSVTSLEVVNDLVNFIKANAVPQPQASLIVEGWNLGDATNRALLAKIKAKGQPLEKYVGSKIYYGIKTGYNEAFIVDRATQDRLIAEDPKSIEIIKPFLRGKDVKRYKVTFANLFLILAYRGIDFKKYPAVFQHLKQYETQLKAKAGGNQWYELQASPGDFSKFEKPKIVYPDIAASCRFSYDTTGLYGVNTNYFIPSSDKYLLGLLNSRLIEVYYKTISSQIRGGYLRFFSIYMEQLPIATPAPNQRAQIERLVNKLIENGPDVPEAVGWQQEIDRIVYEIYGLTDEEIALVEGH